MPISQLEPGWYVEWATPSPDGETYCDWLMLDRDQANEYGDELVKALRVDLEMMRERGLDPDEPFAWKIEDGELLTKQISRKAFEMFAESDRDGSYYAEKTLRYRAERKVRNLR